MAWIIMPYYTIDAGRIFHYTDLNSIYSQLGWYSNAEIGYTLFLMSIAAPQSTNAFTAFTSPPVAASWRAVSPYCNIMHQVTIVQTVAVEEFHLVSDVGISFSC